MKYMKSTFLVVIGLFSSTVYADSVCNTLKDCLALQKEVAARIKSLSPPPETRTSVSQHQFTRVTDRPELGNAWMSETGVIWGDAVGQEERVGLYTNFKYAKMGYDQANIYCNSLSSEYQYLLPTKAQFIELARQLGQNSESGYIPEIIPNLNADFWSRTVHSESALYKYIFNGEVGLNKFGVGLWGNLSGYYDTTGKALALRCVGKQDRKKK